MEELKANLSTHHKKVFTSMDYSLKVLDGTDLKEDLKILIQRSFTTNSQFSMFLPFQLLFQLVELQEQDKPQDKNKLKPRKLFTNAQSTSIQEEMTNTSFSEPESRPKHQVKPNRAK